MIAAIPWTVGDTTLSTEGVLIENKDMYEITLSLDQIDIVKIKSGMTARVVLDAFPKKTYTGTVSKISAIPIETSGVVSYEATVVLRIEEENIYSKMSTTVEVITAEHENTLLVSNAAITSSGGISYIQIASKLGKNEKRQVIL